MSVTKFIKRDKTVERQALQAYLVLFISASVFTEQAANQLAMASKVCKNKLDIVSKSQRNIIELNDHCLLDILGQLSMKDLNSVASTCRRLHDQITNYLQNFGDFIRCIYFEPERNNVEEDQTEPINL